jgi:hypothetical protein
MKQFFAGWLLLLLGCVVPMALFAAGEATPQAATESFQQLDSDAEQILDQVLTLGADMAVLEEARELSPKTQLLVLVSVDPSSFFQLDSIELKIDDQPATYHQYTTEELSAMAQGGSHRLFWDNVAAGRHQLTANLLGRVPKDPDFRREASLMVISGVGRRVVEIRVASGKNQAFPELSLKEWK